MCRDEGSSIPFQRVLVKRISMDAAGYVENLLDNLYGRTLSANAEKEFAQGDGGELGGKMRALHSSSALVYNFFDFWRQTDPSAIVDAMGFESGAYSMSFERKLEKPPGISGNRANIDVFLQDQITGRSIAIEAKFTEPCHRHTKLELKPAYVRVPGLWDGCPGCAQLASDLVVNQSGFSYLDASQLLKHIVGLKTFLRGAPFVLVFLWYRFPGIEVDTVESEVSEFKRRIGNEVDFKSLTYQELFQNLSGEGLKHRDWLEYMSNRYFLRSKQLP